VANREFRSATDLRTTRIRRLRSLRGHGDTTTAGCVLRGAVAVLLGSPFRGPVSFSSGTDYPLSGRRRRRRQTNNNNNNNNNNTGRRDDDQPRRVRDQSCTDRINLNRPRGARTVVLIDTSSVSYVIRDEGTRDGESRVRGPESSRRVRHKRPAWRVAGAGRVTRSPRTHRVAY